MAFQQPAALGQIVQKGPMAAGEWRQGGGEPLRLGIQLLKLALHIGWEQPHDDLERLLQPL